MWNAGTHQIGRILLMLIGEVHGQCKCEMCGVSDTCANCFGHVRVIALRCVTAPMDSVVFLRAVTKCVSRSATNPSTRRHNMNSIFVLSEAQQTMNRPGPIWEFLNLRVLNTAPMRHRTHMFIGNLRATNTSAHPKLHVETVAKGERGSHQTRLPHDGKPWPP